MLRLADAWTWDFCRFIGELTDPMPIGWATDGSALKLDVAAPVTDATPGQSSLPHRTGGIPNGTDTSRSRGKGVHGRREGRRRPEPRRQGRRVHGVRRPVRVRQVDRAAVHRGAG